MNRIKNKKAQALNLVTMVIIALLVIAVLGMAVLITLSQFTTVYTSKDTPATTILNETISGITETTTGTLSVSTLYNVACSVLTVQNETSGNVIASDNYTTSGTGSCTIAYSGDGNLYGYNGSNWNVTYSYTAEYAGLDNVEGNVSEGITGFFDNAPTFFTLLAVVVIILIIGLVILAVRRFGAVSGSGITPGSGLKPSEL